MTFSTLGLAPESLRAVEAQGYTEPTPVQARAIPVVLSGRDLLAGAQTGTGKTAAFVLPMLDGLRATRTSGHRRCAAWSWCRHASSRSRWSRACARMAADQPIRSLAVYGGVRMDRQVRSLRKWPEIIVATPGRLLDHVRQGTVDLSSVEILVLDEADRMLDMGFIHDIKRIIEQLPRERQTLLFSATFSTHIRRLAADLLRDPESIDVAPRNATPAPIRQLVHPVDKNRKRHLLAHMVRDREMGQVLVFTRTKRGANRLAEQLGKDGIRAAAIHGNKSQNQRVRALTAFKKGEAQVLVATDVAARGLDIDALPHVVNYELPTVPEDYVHRIGRTGRAGQEGTAISLMSGDERELMAGIEKLLKRSIEREVVHGFEPSLVHQPEPIVTTRPRQGRPHRTDAHRDGRGAPRTGGGSSQGWVGGRESRGIARPASRDGSPSRQGRAGSAGRGRPQPAGAAQGQPGSIDARGSHGQVLPGERLSGRGAQGGSGYRGAQGGSAQGRRPGVVAGREPVPTPASRAAPPGVGSRVHDGGTMKTALDCSPCLVRQSLDASRAVSDDVAVHQQVLREMLVWTAQADPELLAAGPGPAPPPPAARDHRHRRPVPR